MIDYIMVAADEATLISSIGAIVPVGINTAALHDGGIWRPDVAVPVTILQSGVPVTGQFALWVGLPSADSNLAASATCQLVTDRSIASAGNTNWVLQTTWTALQLNTNTIAPVEAGSLYYPLDFPYPTFPFTTLVRYRLATDFSTDARYSATDTASSDNPYGAATIPQLSTNGLGIVRPSALTTTSGVDVRNGSIRLNYKPISGIPNLSTWQVRLFSTTNPASPGSNYHQCDYGNFKSQNTGGSGTGRWQSIATHSSVFTANGTGADLSAIRLVQILFFGSAVFQFGDVEYVPNPRSKGAVIIRFDDGLSEAPTYGYPIMQAATPPVPGMLMPGAVGSNTGIGTAGGMSIAQYQMLMAAGWQSASQCFSTESNTIVDGWTHDQRMAEYASTRNWARQYNKFRDTLHGSYYSNVGFGDMTAWPELRDSFQTLSNFVNGNGSGSPLSGSGETFPFGDPKNIINLNFNSWGNVSDIYESHIFAALEQTRLSKGLLVVASHNEIALANFQSALSKIINYVNVLWPDQMEFTTLRKLLAPYNGDTLLG